MEIKINGQAADITTDSEKTVGDVMSALESWIENTGHRLSALAIDGKTVDISSLEGAFSKDINSVKILDISTSSIADLLAQSLFNLLDDINDFEALDFENRASFIVDWMGRAEAAFAAEQAQDLYLLFSNTFKGEGVSCDVLRSITEERLREVKNPAVEFIAIQSLINENCSRLADIGIDIQTGKDALAAQTIQIFSALTEKIFRIFRQMELQGFFYSKGEDLNHASQLITAFSSVVKEFLQAYTQNDSVLVGDIAEYELAPKLRELYDTIVKCACENAAVNKV